MIIEQAIYSVRDTDGHHFLGRSSGFLDAWLAVAERLCIGFGDRPPGVTCPLAIFACPFARQFVAIVQVTDQTGSLTFRILVLPARLYADLGGDPFWISDQAPPDWTARGELPTITWSAGPSPRRLVADLHRILDVQESHTQMLLGGAQILLDGGRLVFERDRPDDTILRDLWSLLPNSTRQAIWPASFTFSNQHHFAAVVTPQVEVSAAQGYTPEDQAGDYPEGRYEYALQHAVENNAQGELDALLSRRSGAQMMRLALGLLIGFVLVAVLINFPFGGKPHQDNDQQEVQESPLRLPDIDAVKPIAPVVGKKVVAHLKRLAGQLDMVVPADPSDAALASAIAQLDRQLDQKLGDKRPRRNPGPMDKLGPAERRLRALLWKHDVPGYDLPFLDADELLVRLERKLVLDHVLKEEEQ